MIGPSERWKKIVVIPGDGVRTLDGTAGRSCRAAASDCDRLQDPDRRRTTVPHPRMRHLDRIRSHGTAEVAASTRHPHRRFEIRSREWEGSITVDRWDEPGLANRRRGVSGRSPYSTPARDGRRKQPAGKVSHPDNAVTSWREPAKRPDTRTMASSADKLHHLARCVRSGTARFS